MTNTDTENDDIQTYTASLQNGYINEIQATDYHSKLVRNAQGQVIQIKEMDHQETNVSLTYHDNNLTRLKDDNFE